MHEIDISNQINNSWNKDTVIAMVNNISPFSIKLRSDIKSKIKANFISGDKSHDSNIILFVYAYMLCKCLILKSVHEVIICRDHRPTDKVYRYIQKISPQLGVDIVSRTRISFRKSKIVNGKKIKTPESKADRHARAVFQNKKRADYVITSTDYEKLEELIKKLL